MADVVSQLKSVAAELPVLAWADALELPWRSQVEAVLGSAAPPAAVVYPKTEAELAQVMTWAADHHWRVLPCGNATKLDWGGLATGLDLVVSTRSLNQIVEFAAGDLTVTVEAGTRLADLQARLQGENQFLPIDPLYPQQSTIGGLIATADQGPLRQRYGSLRDLLIGISFVRHDGQIAKAGGRVVKNVAGYDMMKLLTGSYGSLGLITQVTLRTFPGQEASQTVVVSGDSTAIGGLMAAVRGSSLTPVRFDLLSSQLALALALAPQLTLAIQFKSLAAGVDEQVGRLQMMAQTSGLTPQVIEAQAETDLWQGITAQLRGGPEDQPPEPSQVLIKLGLLPTAAVAFMDQFTALTQTLGRARIHCGSGLGMIQLAGSAATAETLTQLRQSCQDGQGYLILLRGPQSLKQQIDVWGYDGSALGLMRALKQQFDPEQRLSPGRFVGGI